MVLVLNSVLPIFAVIALGSLLKRVGLIDDRFISASDRLVYYVFFPALLFWKIGKPATAQSIDWSLVPAVWIAVFIAFAASLVHARLVRMPDREVGSFSQACYRFSTYIGMAVIVASMGEEGVRQFGVLIGFVIPFINLLAVSSLIWFSGEDYTGGKKLAVLVKSALSNPLILACVAGILYSELAVPLPVFLDNTLGLMSLLALPLALISIGGSLTFKQLSGHFESSLAAAAIKLVFLPVVGFLLLRFFRVDETPFKVAMLYFALPTSPNNYILSAHFKSDCELATATIVLSTLLSMASLSAVLLLFG
jgi:malonate transporter and related proteins